MSPSFALNGQVLLNGNVDTQFFSYHLVSSMLTLSILPSAVQHICSFLMSKTAILLLLQTNPSVSVSKTGITSLEKIHAYKKMNVCECVRYVCVLCITINIPIVDWNHPIVPWFLLYFFALVIVLIDWILLPLTCRFLACFLFCCVYHFHVRKRNSILLIPEKERKKSTGKEDKKVKKWVKID